MCKRIYDFPTPKSHNVLTGSRGTVTKNKYHKTQDKRKLTHKSKTQPLQSTIRPYMYIEPTPQTINTYETKNTTNNKAQPCTKDIKR